MLEVASLGVKVLQTHSVELAKKYNVPIRVLCSFEEGPGTLVTGVNEKMEQELVSGIAYNKDEAKAAMQDKAKKLVLGAKDLYELIK